MHVITDAAAMTSFLAAGRDTALNRLLAERIEQLACYEGYDLGDLAHFLIVEPHDCLPAIEAALGFSPLPDAWGPRWETLNRRGGWFEVTFVLDDSGFGWVLLVPEGAGPAALSEALVTASEHPQEP